jgi:hypothetical protein
MAVENFRERDYVALLRVNASYPRLTDRPILFSSRQPDTTVLPRLDAIAIFHQVCDFAGLRDRRSEVKVRQCGK